MQLQLILKAYVLYLMWQMFYVYIQYVYRYIQLDDV